jgi:hypothetical protein
MQLTIDETFEAAVNLPEDQRLELVDRLMDATPPDGIMSDGDPGFHDELQRKFSDGSESIPWSEVRDKV